MKVICKIQHCYELNIHVTIRYLNKFAHYVITVPIILAYMKWNLADLILLDNVGKKLKVFWVHFFLNRTRTLLHGYEFSLIRPLIRWWKQFFHPMATSRAFPADLVCIAGVTTVLKFTIYPYHKCASLDTSYKLLRKSFWYFLNQSFYNLVAKHRYIQQGTRACLRRSYTCARKPQDHKPRTYHPSSH